jgi:hypothetical protein
MDKEERDNITNIIDVTERLARLLYRMFNSERELRKLDLELMDLTRKYYRQEITHDEFRIKGDIVITKMEMEAKNNEDLCDSYNKLLTTYKATRIDF